MSTCEVDSTLAVKTGRNVAVRDNMSDQTQGQHFGLRASVCVKQGDIISPLLLNLSPDHAIRQWRVKLTDGSLSIERLKHEMARIGLEFNADKTRVNTG